MKFFGKKKVYCDSASTTPIDLRVSRAMKKVEVVFANPSSIYADGVVARKHLHDARVSVAKVLNVKPYEVIFTSGGTESNNLAIFGTIKSLIKSGRSPKSLHIISSTIEHSSVLGPLNEIEKEGVCVTRISPKADGIVSVEDIQNAITPDTVLVSIMYVNNEVGTIQPVAKIGNIVREENNKRVDGNKTPVIFHTDASQAPLAVSLSADKLGVHLMTFDGHKIYGPKGVGALYVKKGISISSVLYGGGQEAGLRSTTENISGIIGFATALKIANENREVIVKKMKVVRDTFLKNLKIHVPQAILNGSLDERVPQNINVWIPNIDAEFAVIKLDQLGVSCSTKSSCLKGEEESYVIRAMTNDSSRAKTSLRFTFLKSATPKDAIFVVESIAKAII
jgi:cysteine desulfurase